MIRIQKYGSCTKTGRETDGMNSFVSIYPLPFWCDTYMNMKRQNLNISRIFMSEMTEDHACNGMWWISATDGRHGYSGAEPERFLLIPRYLFALTMIACLLRNGSSFLHLSAPSFS